MRKITFWLTLVLIFTIPWEDSITISGTNSITKMLGLGIAGFWFLTILIEGRFQKPHFFHALVLLFFSWSIVSYLWTANLDDTYQRIKTYGQIFILMLIVWEMLREPSDLKAGLQAYVLGAYVLVASSFYNYLHGISSKNWEVRYSATGVNANDLVLFLLIAMPIAWHLFTHSDKKYRILKVINLVYLPLAVFTALLTASRTSLFAVIPAVIFIAWPKRFDASRILLMLVLLIFSVLILQAILPASVTERLSTATSSISSADFGGRASLWRDSINVFLEHPILGSGSATLPTIIGGLAHQTFLSVLAETGLIGFILFCSILIFVFTQVIRQPKGYTGLWLSTFGVWFIGIITLSFEFRKITWLIFSFMIIQGRTLSEQWRSQAAELRSSEAEESHTAVNATESKVFRNYQDVDKGSAR